MKSKIINKPKIDALSEMRMSKSRVNFIGHQKGQPVQNKVCIICGYKSSKILKDNTCDECKNEFPIKK